jgi:hypothetical protein
VTERGLDRQLKTAVALTEPLMLFLIAGVHRGDFRGHGDTDFHHSGLHSLDPWGNPFIYEYPGKRNPYGFDLMSMGPDGRVGGGDDITNWDEERR